jgi:hypothetical protein
MGPFLSRGEVSENGLAKAQVTRRDVLALAALGLAAGVPRLASAAAGPEGQLTWGIHTTLAPAWLDPADTPALSHRSWSSTHCTMRR